MHVYYSDLTNYYQVGDEGYNILYFQLIGEGLYPTTRPQARSVNRIQLHTSRLHDWMFTFICGKIMKIATSLPVYKQDNHTRMQPVSDGMHTCCLPTKLYLVRRYLNY